MLTFARAGLLLVFTATVINAATLVDQGRPAGDPGTQNLNGTHTDSDKIADTVTAVDQKSGPAPDDPPGRPPSNTSVTALDGELVNQSANATRRSNVARRFPRRLPEPIVARDIQDCFVEVFQGNDKDDGSIEGTAYMTFTTVENSTYNVPDCLQYCNSMQGCAFVNLYYEFNNPGLDVGPSNLKCAAYGDIHKAEEKTNRGGQQLCDDCGLTYIRNSSGWALKDYVDPGTPKDYEPVGLLPGANNAPGYMGFAFLDRYDPDACADLCNNRGPDPVGGICRYFNIWRAVVNGTPTTYTCSMYFILADPSTANNFGQGDLQVTESRGYSRKDYIIDGDFESFVCKDGSDFCYDESDDNWTGTSSPSGHWDALIFHHKEYAYSGDSVATLGSGDGSDPLHGSYTPKVPLATERGQKYCLQFWHASYFNGALEAAAFLQISWNGKIIDTIRPGNSSWKVYFYTVDGTGNGDVLTFTGGAYPAYSFIDLVGIYAVKTSCPT